MEEQTMTGLKVGTLHKKMRANMEKTQALAGTIEPRKVGGKDMRTMKQKREDLHLVQF